jgi:RNA polymerase sigma-70 factor, ECF subfamily
MSEQRAAGAPRQSSAVDADAAAVRAAQSDRSAFDTLYERYLDRVYSYAFYELGDHHDAEDVTERTFLSALAAIGEFRDEGATFRAWLFRIAHNAIVNAHRTRARRRVLPLPDGFDRPSRDADPATLLTRAEDRHRVMRAVNELPGDRRAVILLRFVDGLSTREIATVLDRSPGAVRVLQHRALRDLAERLGDHGLDPEV